MGPAPDYSALFALARAGGPGSSLVAGLAKLQTQDAQLTTGVSVLSRVLATPAGQSFARWQVIREQRRDTASADVRSTVGQQRLAELQTPVGQAQQQRLLAAQGQQQTHQAAIASRHEQAKAAYLATPQGQRHAGAQYGSELHQRTAVIRQAAAETRAKAGYLATPQGRSSEQAIRSAQREQAAAQESLARQQNISQYGRLGGGILNAAAAFSKLNPYLSAAQTAVSAANRAWNGALSLAGKASPNTAATFAKSSDLLQARIGQLFVPAVEKAAQVIQRFAELIPDPRSRPGRFAINASSKPADWLFRLIGGDDKSSARSMAGLPQPAIGTGEQYQQSLQLAALQTQGGTLEAKLLQEQIKALEALGVLLKIVATNTGDRGGSFPAFR